MRKIAGAFNLGCAAFIGLLALWQLSLGNSTPFLINSGLCAINIFCGAWNLTATNHIHSGR